MIFEKATNFAKAILERTEAGLISWEVTENETRFEASYPDQLLAVFENSGIDSHSGEPYTVYMLSLINSAGRVVSQVEPSDINAHFSSNGNELLQRLYSLAKDKALRVDDELAKLYKTFQAEDGI